jgi:hypothetical protein
MAKALNVVGLMNVQFAIQGQTVYVLEVNPRASRTVPFVSKATAVPLAKAAARVMLGATIAQLREIGMLPALGDGGELPPNSPVCVKEAVLPFGRFLGIDTILGPEMRSTGEVMGIDRTFGVAFAKAQAGAMSALPTSGTVFISVANRDKRSMIFPVKRLHDLGFEIVATEGTAEILRRNGVPSRILRKLRDGTGPNGEPTTVDAILAGDVDLIVNTPYGVGARLDGYEIRTAAVLTGRPCITTVQGLAAAVQGIDAVFVPANVSMTASKGTFTLTGVAATLTKSTAVTGYTLAADAGSFNLTGIAAGLAIGRKVTVTQGTFSLTGIAAGLKVGRVVTATAQSFTLTGIATNLKATRTITGAVRSFALAGVDNRLAAPRKAIRSRPRWPRSSPMSWAWISTMSPSSMAILPRRTTAWAPEAVGRR